MDLKEMFERMSSGAVKAHSELGTRDESKQTTNFGTRFQKMKTVTGINARALVMKDLVIPFNPFTGSEDKDYNKKTPYRPILLVSQAIEGIKSMCDNIDGLRDFWEKELGITLSDGKTTKEEYLAFKARGYIKPRIMSYSTVAINFAGMKSFPEFRVKYTVDPTELNEEGSYDVQKAPIWHQAAVFFNAMLRPEAENRKKNLEEQGASKETIANERRAVFSKSPVGFVRPTNLIPFLYFPLYDGLPKLDPENPQELEQHIRFFSYTDKWTTPMNDVMKNPLFDEVIDYFDFTIKTPSSSDVKPNGKVYTDEDSMELYTAMNIANTDGRLALLSGSTVINGNAVSNKEVFAPIFATAEAYFMWSQGQSFVEGGETFEKIMAMSNKFRPITSVLDNFLPACNEIFNKNFANTAYFTEEIRDANSKFFAAMNPANAIAMAAKDDEDLEEAANKQKESMAELISELTFDGTDVIEDDAILEIE